jgi:hypothetical protein
MAASLLGQSRNQRPEVARALEQARDYDPRSVVRMVAGWYAPGGRNYEKRDRWSTIRRLKWCTFRCRLTRGAHHRTGSWAARSSGQDALSFTTPAVAHPREPGLTDKERPNSSSVL